jgi:lipoprotein-anchoring transpeptidase ErfK/SrfK
MERLRLLAVPLLAASLALAAGSEVAATTLISIDKPSQTMTVSVDGAVQYRWRVSTGATGFSTPAGTYTPFRMEVMHYSQEWDNAGMPHTIFFTSRGHGIHGSDHPGLGTPRSHGCVRLTLTNAATLYRLVQAQGMGNTKVVVKGADPPGHWEATVAPQLQTGSRARRPPPFFPFGIFGGR